MKENTKREIRLIQPSDIEQYLDVYLNAYPAYKSIGNEGREKYGKRVLHALENDKTVHYYGMFEGGKLIATMKLIDFSMNFFGRMRPATGIMALGVHPLHKKKGAALDMVRFFEEYTGETGGLVSMLLPFRVDFYRKMGYGYGSKMDEYRLPTRFLPACDQWSCAEFLTCENLPEILDCYTRIAGKNHGMVLKFEDEIRDMASDSESRRIGFREDGILKGYVTFRFESESDVNYTANRMEVDELIYEDGRVLRILLGFLRSQADLAETVVIRTGEEDFYHLLPNPQDTSGNYIPFGYLQTNISAMGTMYKIVDLPAFVEGTAHRQFPADELTTEFIYLDEMTGEEHSFVLEFTTDEKGIGRWKPANPGTLPRVSVHCTLADLSSLFMGCYSLEAMARLGCMTISDESYLLRLDRLLHYHQKPWTNTDY